MSLVNTAENLVDGPPEAGSGAAGFMLPVAGVLNRSAALLRRPFMTRSIGWSCASAKLGLRTIYATRP
jgi:hypothetical protein